MGPHSSKQVSFLSFWLSRMGKHDKYKDGFYNIDFFFLIGLLWRIFFLNDFVFGKGIKQINFFTSLCTIRGILVSQVYSVRFYFSVEGQIQHVFYPATGLFIGLGQWWWYFLQSTKKIFKKYLPCYWWCQLNSLSVVDIILVLLRLWFMTWRKG